MTSAWHGEVDHLGLPPRNGSISVSGNLIGAGKKGAREEVTFKAGHWPDSRIHPVPMTCFIILLGSVLGAYQIFKSYLYH